MEYVIGVDFGTLSCRAVLVDRDGELIQSGMMEYPHGVIATARNGARQEPADYLMTMEYAVRKAARGYETRVVGIGVDFTSCTVLPVDEGFQALGQARLWKSHSAEDQSVRITALCGELGIDLSDQGGVVRSEMMLPKLLELKETEPEIYEKTASFVEAGDWIAWLLTGKKVRSTNMAGFKGLWRGDWPRELLQRLDLDEQLFEGAVAPAGALAGTLQPAWAERLNLPQGIAVAVSVIDAHATVFAAGLSGDAEMTLTLGTSGSYLTLSGEDAPVPGLLGKVKDGIFPGCYVYETGHSSLGDTFGWFMENCVPHSYYEASGGNVFGYLEQLAAGVRENSVWALDWWNGNRSPYANPNLTGTIFGLGLQTRPEHIYRALLESTAFGIRHIVELLEEGGIAIRKMYAGGGISKKNRLLMQILADVLGREVYVMDREPASAVGAAVMAAAAAGLWESPQAAAKAMSRPAAVLYSPDPNADYEAAYSRYLKTAEYMAHQD